MLYTYPNDNISILNTFNAYTTNFILGTSIVTSFTFNCVHRQNNLNRLFINIKLQSRNCKTHTVFIKIITSTEKMFQ